MVQLQQDIEDYRTELRLNRTQTPAISTRPMKRSGFTSTPVHRFSGKSNWEQYRQVFEAIVRSNGWDDITAALQLLSHLDGDALNVALLVPESQRVLPGLLVKSLSDHYSSPVRLAEYKRQVKRAFRRPGDDYPLLSPAAPKARDGRYCNAPRLSVCLSVSVRPSVPFSFRTVTQKRIDVFSRNFAGTCTMSWRCAV